MRKIIISTSNQELNLLENDDLIRQYQISTGKNGVGELFGSEKTPRGSHTIRAKIGKDAPPNTVFVGRRPTGKQYQGEALDRDWILTRILWLCGKEPGKNRFGEVDTMRRFIYIHGTPDKVQLGQPGSRGCIRMRNNDIVELFNLVKIGTEVNIT